MRNDKDTAGKKDSLALHGHRLDCLLPWAVDVRSQAVVLYSVRAGRSCCVHSAHASMWLGARGGCRQPGFEGPCADPQHGYPLPAPPFSLLGGDCVRENFQASMSLGHAEARGHAQTSRPRPCSPILAEIRSWCKLCSWPNVR